MGTGAGVAADAAPADSKRVPAAKVVVTRTRTLCMIDAFRVVVNVLRLSRGPMLVVTRPAGILWYLHFDALKYRFQRGTMEKR